VKVPSGYSSNIKKLVHATEQKFLPMKAHDCDVILTTMLDVGIRNILPEKICMAIIGMCLFLLTVLTPKIQPSKPRVQEEYMTNFMQIFSTNEVPQVVL
jgi:hypothetical protein